MNNKLIRISTETMPPGSKAWLDYRLNGIGGSEVSAILGLNPYFSSHRLFYQKLQEDDYDPENVHMYFGKKHEEMIAEEWEYHDPADPSFETRAANFNAGKKVRRCRRVNAYIINPDFPHLFASVDRLINKGDNEAEGILECKTISSFAARSWEAGIPPMHVVQLQFYLLVCELEYGELATLKDGKYFEVLPFERSEQLINLIKEGTAEFWDRVTRARILKQEGKPYAQLEPETDNQEAYKIFLSERYKAEPKKINPDLYYYNLGIKYLELGAKEKEIKAEQTMVANQIKEYMKDSDTMDFGAAGAVTWKQNKASMKLNADALKEGEPAIYDKYLVETPGARVLRVNLKIKNAETIAA